MPRTPDPCVIVIFGASGDLTARKIIPALYAMSRAGDLPEATCVLGISRTGMSDDQWRDSLGESTRAHAGDAFDQSSWNAFAQRLFYLPGSATDAELYGVLAERIAALAVQFQIGGNVLFYLSVKPSLYEPIIDRIHEARLVQEGQRWCSLDRDATPWQRVIVEKPIGHDLASAQSLNRTLGRAFEEDAIFRIDHYLGKELVQNLLVFRFANAIFEPIWNHHYIDHVQITAAETVGVGHRASFYDEVGAVRDMFQSHLLQVLALVAMEPPTDFRPHCIRQEKIQIIDAINPIDAGELADAAVFGQYAGDDDEPAYHLNPDCADGTSTETFAAIRLQFNNWRWAGTPFYLRTGKRMAAKRTEVVVEFKRPPADLFANLAGTPGASHRAPNRIIIEIGPGAGLHLRLEGKIPGSGASIGPVTMDFDLEEQFNRKQVEAYGPLILDAMSGDQTLFPHRYEVEGAWRAVTPLIGPASMPLRVNLNGNYEPGSWGPVTADEMLARHGRAWHNE